MIFSLVIFTLLAAAMCEVSNTPSLGSWCRSCSAHKNTEKTILPEVQEGTGEPLQLDSNSETEKMSTRSSNPTKFSDQTDSTEIIEEQRAFEYFLSNVSPAFPNQNARLFEFGGGKIYVCSISAFRLRSRVHGNFIWDPLVSFRNTFEYELKAFPVFIFFENHEFRLGSIQENILRFDFYEDGEIIEVIQLEYGFECAEICRITRPRRFKIFRDFGSDVVSGFREIRSSLGITSLPMAELGQKINKQLKEMVKF